MLSLDDFGVRRYSIEDYIIAVVKSMKATSSRSVLTHLCTPLLPPNPETNKQEHKLLFAFRSKPTTTATNSAPPQQTETIYLFNTGTQSPAFSYVLPKNSTTLMLQELVFPNIHSLLQCLVCVRRENEETHQKFVELQMVALDRSKFRMLTPSKAPPELHKENYLRVQNHTNLSKPFFEMAFLMDSCKILYFADEYSPDWYAKLGKSNLTFDTKSYGTIVDFCFDDTTRKDDGSFESKIAVLCKKDGTEDEKFVILLLKVDHNPKSKAIKKIDKISVSSFLNQADRKFDYSRLLYCSEIDSYVIAGLKMDEESSYPETRNKVNPKFNIEKCSFGNLGIVVMQTKFEKEMQIAAKPVIRSSTSRCIFPEFPEREILDRQQLGLISSTTHFERLSGIAQFSVNFTVQGSSTLSTLELRGNIGKSFTAELSKPLLQIFDLTKDESEASFNDNGSGDESDSIGGIRHPHPITTISKVVPIPPSKDTKPKSNPEVKKFAPLNVYINTVPTSILSCNFSSSKLQPNSHHSN